VEAAGTLSSVPAKPITESIHRASHGNRGAAIDIADYLGTIVEGIVSGRSNGKILLRADFQARFLLPLDKAVQLGLIVGELVTNSIKYAHPAGVIGVININSSRRDGAIVIEVSDDGVGLPDGVDPLTAGDTGLCMIQTLATQLRATISFDNHGLGLSCTLRMPYAEIAL
jgi:two-component sensor histidine kinase